MTVFPQVQPRRVLLVEDNEINRRVALGLLHSRGHQAVVAVNGQQAVEMLSDQEFDVVLMDMQMPVMDGYEATVEIRRRERQTGGHIPIVAMTAEALKGDREHCLATGMDDYVSKPIAPAEMYRAIERFPAVCLPVDFHIQNPAEPAEVLIRGAGETSHHKNAARPSGSERRSDTAAPVTVPAIDWDVAKRLLGNDTAVLTEFADVLKSEAPQRLAEIRSAIETHDSTLLRRAAHTLKGSSAYFGAEPLTRAALALEQLGKAESFAGAAEMLEMLEQELTRLLTALDSGPPESTV